MAGKKKNKNRPPPFSKEPEQHQRHVADHADKTRGVDKGGLHKIIVGLDFGTTGTGVSWVPTEGAHSKSLDDVHCIRDWPGCVGYSSKTPSRIAYAAENIITLITNAWGFEVAEKMRSYTWFKLLLDLSVATKIDDPSLANSEGDGVLRLPANKTAVEVCADFLAEIASFAYSVLEKRLTKEVLDATPLEFWFTVPAVWSDKAKSDTLRAAKMAARQANLDLHPRSRVFMIAEPEAAATAIMAYLTKGGSQQQICAGDNIMILDCGGGTVDIVSYKIIATTPRLEFEELIVGTGGKCGSTYIDREMIKWMTAQFGEAYLRLSREKCGPASPLMQKFEVHKRGFQSVSATRTYELPVVMSGVDSDSYDNDEYEVILTHSELKQMFDTVIEQIIALLQSQLDALSRQSKSATIKTIMLPGGFGDSKYLNEKLRAWCGNADIRLICPEDPQSAIVRGAALGGLNEIQPSSRRARKHYGIAVMQPFDPLRHQNKDMITNSWDGMPYADRQMSWKLNKGAIVNQSTSIDFDLTSRVSEHDLSTAKYFAAVYCSELDDAPRTCYADGCQKLGDIVLDFREVDLSAFPMRPVDGSYCRRVRANYVVNFGDRCGLLCFTASVNGQEIGTTVMQFDGQGDGQGSRQSVEADGETHALPCAMQ